MLRLFMKLISNMKTGRLLEAIMFLFLMHGIHLFGCEKMDSLLVNQWRLVDFEFKYKETYLAQNHLIRIRENPFLKVDSLLKTDDTCCRLNYIFHFKSNGRFTVNLNNKKEYRGKYKLGDANTFSRLDIRLSTKIPFDNCSLCEDCLHFLKMFLDTAKSFTLNGEFLIIKFEYESAIGNVKMKLIEVQ